MFGNHGLGGLPEEGAHGKSSKCLGGSLGGFWGILQRSLFNLSGIHDFVRSVHLDAREKHAWNVI